LVATDVTRCCALCRFWVEDYAENEGYGHCQNSVPNADPNIINGASYVGGAGLETYAASVCPAFQKFDPKKKNYPE
jgi:hypothetical protein